MVTKGSLDKRENILKAAKTLFLAHGYSGTSMDAVTQAAKVSKRTIYQYFHDKMQLFNAVIIKHWQTLLTDPNIQIDSTQPIDQVLRYFANELIKFFFTDETITLFRIVIAETYRYPDLVQAMSDAGRAPATFHLISYLRQQAEAKRLNITDPVLAAQQFMGLIKESLFWPKILGVSHGEVKANQTEIINAAVNMFLNFYNPK